MGGCLQWVSAVEYNRKWSCSKGCYSIVDGQKILSILRHDVMVYLMYCQTKFTKELPLELRTHSSPPNCNTLSLPTVPPNKAVVLEPHQSAKQPTCTS